MTKKSLVLAFVAILAASGKVRADGLYAGNFTLSVSPAVKTVAPGGAATFTLTISPVVMPGYPLLPQGEVELRAVAPRGLTASVSPAVVELGAAPVTAVGTVVVADPNVIAGTFPVVFAALGSENNRTVTVSVIVK
jgi:hypothetical protein